MATKEELIEKIKKKQLIEKIKIKQETSVPEVVQKPAQEPLDTPEQVMQPVDYLRGLGSGVTMGAAPAIEAAGEQLVELAKGKLPEGGYRGVDKGKLQENIDQYHQLREDYPVQFTASEVAGGVVSPLNKAAKGGQLLRAGVEGARGAVQGYGATGTPEGALLGAGISMAPNAAEGALRAQLGATKLAAKALSKGEQGSAAVERFTGNPELLKQAGKGTEEVERLALEGEKTLTDTLAARKKEYTDLYESSKDVAPLKTFSAEEARSATSNVVKDDILSATESLPELQGVKDKLNEALNGPILSRSFEGGLTDVSNTNILLEQRKNIDSLLAQTKRSPDPTQRNAIGSLSEIRQYIDGKLKTSAPDLSEGSRSLVQQADEVFAPTREGQKALKSLINKESGPAAGKFVEQAKQLGTNREQHLASGFQKLGSGDLIQPIRDQFEIIDAKKALNTPSILTGVASDKLPILGKVAKIAPEGLVRAYNMEKSVIDKVSNSVGGSGKLNLSLQALVKARRAITPALVHSLADEHRVDPQQLQTAINEAGMAGTPPDLRSLDVKYPNKRITESIQRILDKSTGPVSEEAIKAIAKVKLIDPEELKAELKRLGAIP